MPRPESQTRDNCRVPLSEIQFPRKHPKNSYSTTDKHCPFEINTFKHICDHINKKTPKIDNSTKILVKFCLKNGLKTL